MNSRTPNFRETLALRTNKKRAAKMLLEFVRERDFKAWAKKWTSPGARRLLDWMQSDDAQMNKVPPPKIGNPDVLRYLHSSPEQLQADMRAIWWGVGHGELPGHLCADIVKWWLRLGDRHPGEWANLHPEEPLEGPPVTVDWDSGQIVIVPQTLDDLLWSALLQNSSHLAICENSSCPHHFFLRVRRQRFCSEKCANPAQKEHKKKWWSRHGKAWRKQRPKKRGEPK